MVCSRTIQTECLQCGGSSLADLSWNPRTSRHPLRPLATGSCFMALQYPIPLLVLFHVVIGLLAAFASADRPAVSSAIFFGVVFCQAALIGMWAGLGATTRMLRLLGVGVGATYLAVQLGLGLDELGFEIFLLVILLTSLVSVVTWFVRLFKGNLRKTTPGQTDLQEGLQFGIRHLMLLTFVVACMTFLGKILAPTVSGLEVMSIISIFSVCYAAVALTSIWAILGQGHPAVRSAFVVGIALVAGIVCRYTAGSDLFWPSVTLLQAVFLVGSLSVVRIAGYRFTAK